MILLAFDGLCQPKNPGGVATYGFVITRGRKRIDEGRGLAAEPYAPEATNNVAEYTGVIRGLERLIEKGWSDEPVVVRGDSQLVIEQLNGRYKVRAANIAPLFARVRELFFRFPSVKFEWVPREKNREADQQTNLAYQEFLDAERAGK